MSSEDFTATQSQEQRQDALVRSGEGVPQVPGYVLEELRGRGPLRPIFRPMSRSDLQAGNADSLMALKTDQLTAVLSHACAAEMAGLSYPSFLVGP